MAMSKLEAIMETFAANGKATTPVAIIQDGTTPHEKMITGTVSDIAFRAQHAGLSNPAIIMVGEVVALQDPHLRQSLADLAYIYPDETEQAQLQPG